MPSMGHEQTTPVKAGSQLPSTVLVVDDEPAICALLETFLKGQGYEVLVASNANEALQNVQNLHPTIVLLDIRLPEMDGTECLRRIKAIDPQVGVVMVTAVEDENIGRKCLDLGAFEYVTKPISLEHLKTCLLLTQLFLRK